MGEPRCETPICTFRGHRFDRTAVPPVNPAGARAPERIVTGPQRESRQQFPAQQPVSILLSAARSTFYLLESVVNRFGMNTVRPCGKLFPELSKDFQEPRGKEVVPHDSDGRVYLVKDMHGAPGQLPAAHFRHSESVVLQIPKELWKPC